MRNKAIADLAKVVAKAMQESGPVEVPAEVADRVCQEHRAVMAPIVEDMRRHHRAAQAQWDLVKVK